MNFLQETIEAIEEAGREPGDISFIGDSGHRSTWAEFTIVANFNYDNGFGGQEIVESLVIVFADGTWLSRGEYDGSEWWNYNQCPACPRDPVPIAASWLLRESCRFGWDGR